MDGKFAPFVHSHSHTHKKLNGIMESSRWEKWDEEKRECLPWDSRTESRVIFFFRFCDKRSENKESHCMWMNKNEKYVRTLNVRTLNAECITIHIGSCQFMVPKTPNAMKWTMNKNGNGFYCISNFAMQVKFRRNVWTNIDDSRLSDWFYGILCIFASFV